MSAVQLVRLRDGRVAECWPLPADRPIVVGRGVGGEAPDVDLRPDGRVSRRHARLWHAEGAWWIADLGSKRGTRVDGRPLDAGDLARLAVGAAIEIGESTLRLVSPHWHCLRAADLAVEFELAPAVGAVLLHWRPDRALGKLVVRNLAAQPSAAARLRFELAEVGSTDAVVVPALAPGASQPLPAPALRLRAGAEAWQERGRRALTLWLDELRVAGATPECWVLAHNEWSFAPEQRLALAAFVQPNHPLVAQAKLEAAVPGGPSSTAEDALASLHQHFATRWHLDYRLEPPHWESGSQKLRLAHHVLRDPSQRRGEGTCLDLALLFASCLERAGWQPLVAVLEQADGQHAIVGVWRETAERLESLLHDRARLLAGAAWLEVTGCAWDGAGQSTYAAARAAAARLLTEQPLVFALDVAAARDCDGVRPLPFAGDPTWGPEAAQALEVARQLAAGVPTLLSTVPLLLGLLHLPHGLTRRVLATGVADLDDAIAQLTRALPPQDTPPTRPSEHYEKTLRLAEANARAEGEALVQEHHLLLALLDVPSRPLGRALRRLGVDRAGVHAAVELVLGTLAQPKATLGLLSDFLSEP